MRTISEADCSLLVKALVEQKPFYGEGLWTFPSDELNLFLRKEPWCLSLSKDAASTVELDTMLQACEPSFGMNEEDALDPAFRKARNLDKKDFAINLDVVGSGLLQAVHNALFGLDDLPRSIRAELYRLSVYGPGSFSKAHTGTPRNEDMFGSLVLTFPVKHEGGELVLRYGGNEARHDAATVNYTFPNQVAWIAFSNDVEHEVLPVTSGCRVTITYNLHFATNPQSGPVDVADSDSESPSTPVGSALRTLVRSETFLPDGGQLGFALQHQYAIPTDEPAQSVEYLTKLRGALRGADRALCDACDELGLCPCLFLAYAPEGGGVFLLDHVFEGDVGFELGDWDEGLGRRIGAQKIESGDGSDEDEDECYEGEDLIWITPRQSTKTRVKSYYAAYGEKVILGKISGELVLIATVPPKRERDTSPELE